MGEQTSRCWTVSEDEGNEVQGDGRQGVGATHSTEEAGELAPEDPVREGVAVVVELLGGKDGGNIEFGNHLHATPEGSGIVQASPEYGLDDSGPPH